MRAKIVFLSVLILTATLMGACSKPSEVDQVRQIANSVTRPNPEYSDYSGKKLMIGDVRVHPLYFDSSTGRRYYRATIIAYEPDFWRRNFNFLGTNSRREWVLVFPNFYPNAKLGGPTYPDSNYFGYDTDKTQFTLEELHMAQGFLMWK